MRAVITARLGEPSRPPMGEVRIGPKAAGETEEPAARKGRLGSIPLGLAKQKLGMHTGSRYR